MVEPEPTTSEAENIYDPDYEVPYERRMAKSSYSFIESGLQLGYAYLIQVTAKPDSTRDKYKDLRQPLATLENYLKEKDYVVLPTDKNLGTAVVTRQWFIEKSLSLLDDRNYECIPHEKFLKIVQRNMNLVEEAAVVADELGNTQLAQFLRCKIPDDGDAKSYVAPKFYGIPKIHKTPIKMRPILPCHSAITNPCAKYVSKCLKPIINSIPSIIRGTKDFVTKLQGIKIPLDRKAFLVTGDVVAFYPNVPLGKALMNALKWWQRFSKPKDLLVEKLFIRCLNTGNRNLAFRFIDKYYVQKQGLAMGVADSPDLANL